MPLILPQPVTPTFVATSSVMAKSSLFRGFRFQLFFLMPFSCDLPHRNLTILQGRLVTRVDDAGAVEAVLAVLALPVAAEYGLDESPDDGEVSFAGLYLGGHHGRHAGHVGIDAEGVAGAVVLDLHLGAPVGAVQGDPEVVARLPVDGPTCLKVQRRPAGEADKGGGQVLDLVGLLA